MIGSSPRQLTSLCLLALFAGTLRAEQASRPNVIVILVDDMGWTDLTCYGSDLHQTPHIDRLAEAGMRFTNAYASAPVCTPTRAALLTGKAPARLNMTIWHEYAKTPPQNAKMIPPLVEGNLRHDESTIAEVLQHAGYRTGHVGKWHLGDASHYPETHGFDYSFGGSFWGAPATFHFPYRGFRWGEMRYIPGVDAGELREGEHLTDRLTQEALEFIDKASEGPFFLYMSYYTVHTPIEGKPEIADRYRQRINEGMHHDNANYAAMHETLDDNVGRILRKLEEKGVADHTVVILTSDNGGFINEYDGQAVTSNAPLRSGKGALYEGGVRVPLIVHWPGVTTAGSISEEPVTTTDLYPTIVDVTGLTGTAERKQSVDGLNLSPLLKNPASTLDREALYWHYPHYYHTTTPVSAMREGKWKLLEFLEDDHLELYDLEADIGETQNLASSEPALATELKRKLHQWRKEVGAPMPRPNPNYGE
jgi:arylsulfatase A